MTTTNRIVQQIVLALSAGLALGCLIGLLVIAAFAVPPLVVAMLPASPTPTLTPTRPATITLAPTRTATPTSLPIPPTSTAAQKATPSKATASKTPPPPTRTPRPITTHFMVDRPVPLSVEGNFPSRWYLYGTTENGELEVHHGEEFVNPTGTTLLAVANGTIVTAGMDNQPICGDDGKAVCGANIPDGDGFYGKLVVIKLDQGYRGQPVYALYGHMSEIGVSVGDHVSVGTPIGQIGMSGVAMGPHCHFEIRLGVNDYAHTRNPVLWMAPLAGRGAIVGRLADSKGDLIRGALVDVYRSDGTFLLETETYGRDRWPAVNSDDDLNENFTVPDLAVGDYTIRIKGQPYVQHVSVQNGKLSFVELGGLP